VASIGDAADYREIDDEISLVGYIRRGPSTSGFQSSRFGATMGAMSTKSRESIYGTSVRHSAERAAEARKEADRFGMRRLEPAYARFQGTGSAIS
jgi:hypothetical protein